MAGEGYTGHVNGDSAPYQFKIPAATTTQNGVMTKEQVQQLGTIGKNAFTTLTADFVQPAVNANVTASVEDSSWAAVGQIVYVAGGGGYYAVASKPSTTSIALTNLGYDGFSSPGTSIPSPSQVSPGGIRGPSESSFGALVSTTSGGAEVFVGVAGTNASSGEVAGRTVNSPTPISKLVASISPGVYVAPAPVYRVKVYVSTDGGLSYPTAVSGATVDIDVGSANQESVGFSTYELPANSLHIFSVQQLSGGGNTVSRPFSVTLS